MSKITEQNYKDYITLINATYSQRRACNELGIDRTNMQRYLKKLVEQQITGQVKGVSSLNTYDVWKAKDRPDVTHTPHKEFGSFEYKSLYDTEREYYETLEKVQSKNKDKESPRVLFFDIETTLAKSYHFGQWKQNLSVKQQVEEGHLLSHAWAWGDGKVVGSVLTREEILNHDPERLVLEAWSLLDNADIVVAHYGKKFDIPKLNGYFLKYGLIPPSPYKVVDTKEISSRKFLLPFNSLEYLAKALGVQQKIDNSGIQLWLDCDRGKQEALNEMLAYNIGDVEALRDVYYRLITWDNNGVNMALYNDHGASCTHCGGTNISTIEGKYAFTVARKYSLYRCNDCNAILRSNSKEGKGNTLMRIV